MTGQEVTHKAGARHNSPWAFALFVTSFWHESSLELLLVNPITDWWRILTLTKTLSKKTTACIVHCRSSSTVCLLEVRSKPTPYSAHKQSNHQSPSKPSVHNAADSQRNPCIRNMEAVTQACNSNNVQPMSLQSCQMLSGLSEHQHLVVVLYAGAPTRKWK